MFNLWDAIQSARQIKPSRVSTTRPSRIARPVVVATANFGMGLGKIAEAVFGTHQTSTMPATASEMWHQIDKETQLRFQEGLLGEQISNGIEKSNFNYDNRKKVCDETKKQLGGGE